MGKIVQARYLLGVRHWFMWYPFIKYRVVYRYLGKSDDYYWFTDVQTKKNICYTAAHLVALMTQRKFRAFCYDTKRLENLKEADIDVGLKKAFEDQLNASV